MSRHLQPLDNPHQELQARRLAIQLMATQQERFLQIARLLVSSTLRDLCGAIDIELHEHMLQIEADCLKAHLDRTTTIATAPARHTPIANDPPGPTESEH